MYRFKLHFDRFLNNRAEEVSNGIGIFENYIEASNSVRMVWENVFEAMPDNSKHLLYDLEHVINFREAVAQEYMYKQGFKDSIRIKAFLKRL